MKRKGVQKMTDHEETVWRIQHAFVLRALARAINRMERGSLYHEAQQLRAELATMGIELILPVDDESI